MPDKAPGLLAAMLAVQAEAPTLPKDKTNPHYKSRYTPLDTIVEKIGPILTKNRLVWTTLPVHGEDGAPALYYRLAHVDSGEEIAGTMPLLLVKNDSPGLGSALTYARRYSLCAVLNLVADDDDDGNQAATATPAGRVSQTAVPTDQQLKFLKSLVSKEKPPEPVLRAMLRGVGADGVDPMKGGWSKALNRAQVSQLIEVLKSGALPTGESDIPSDLEPGPEPDGEGVPFFEAAVAAEFS